MTIRNILIGFYIVEFEQNGSDRAEYGTDTLKMLAQRLKHIKGVSARQLYRFRDLYNSYPQIFSTVSRKFKDSTFIDQNILPTVSAKFELAEQNDLSFEPELLLSRLSFSHFVELLNADDQLKTFFL